MGHSHGGGMHPALPWDYIAWILLLMLLVLVWALVSKPPGDPKHFSLPLTKIPVLAPLVRYLNSSVLPVSLAPFMQSITSQRYWYGACGGHW